jgi:hypothetical protein
MRRCPVDGAQLLPGDDLANIMWVLRWRPGMATCFSTESVSQILEGSKMGGSEQMVVWEGQGAVATFSCSDVLLKGVSACGPAATSLWPWTKVPETASRCGSTGRLPLPPPSPSCCSSPRCSLGRAAVPLACEPPASTVRQPPAAAAWATTPGPRVQRPVTRPLRYSHRPPAAAAACRAATPPPSRSRAPGC